MAQGLLLVLHQKVQLLDMKKYLQVMAKLLLNQLRGSYIIAAMMPAN
jgi:hypothetical protein